MKIIVWYSEETSQTYRFQREFKVFPMTIEGLERFAIFFNQCAAPSIEILEDYLDYEKLVLSEIMYANKDKQMDYVGELGLADFPTEKWRNLFKVITQIVISGEQADIASVYSKSQDIVDAVELSEMCASVYTDGKIMTHIRMLKEQRYKGDVAEKIKGAYDKITSMQFLDDVEVVKDGLISELSGMSLCNDSAFMNFDANNKLLHENMSNGRKLEGYSWGIQGLDAYTSGIIKKRCYIVGALKKSGKTRFVINEMKNLGIQGVKSAFLSMEMPEYEVNKLIKSSHCQIDDLKLRAGGFISNEERAILRNTPIPYHLFGVECKSGLNKDEVLGRIRKYAKLGYEVIFIDYLQRIKHNRNAQATELEEISNSIADATRINDVAIVMLAQLQNMAEREPPTISHLKGSGGIGESGDTIMLLDNLYRRTTPKDESLKNKMDIILEQRYGDSGVVHLSTALGTCTFGDLAPDYQSI